MLLWQYPRQRPITAGEDRPALSRLGTGCRLVLLAGLYLGYFSPGIAQTASELSGNLALEYRVYQHPPLLDGQHQNNVAFSAQPEYYRAWDDGDQYLTVTPYLRVDQHDSERTHFDMRELFWGKVAEDWELRVGFRQIFWGVTESQHLVDIINQTDAVENLDGEDKLGQPMVNYALIRDWGTVDVFLLTGFRERNYGSPNGRQWRLPYPLSLDQDDARYESSKEDRRLDLALRWSRSVDIWDIGISHFSGTSRDPELEQKSPSEPQVLVPRYDLIEQTGLDLQATLDEWLLKLELISRDTPSGRYTAMTSGVENTLVGIFDTRIDLGLLCEYLFDDRNRADVPFANDVMLGTRFAFNDVQSNELLALLILDLDDQSRLFVLEGSRRLGESWTINLEAKFFSEFQPGHPLYPLRQDDHLQMELAWHF